MSANPEADRQVDKFAGDLATASRMNGWQLLRTMAGNADRMFQLKKNNVTIPFTVHISLSGNGFWGLTAEKAHGLVANGREHLVLLRDGGGGFFIPNPILKRLMPQFSIAQESGAVKINENKVRAQARFRDADDLLELLEARSPSPAS